jgi:hypothetical protein
MLEQPEDRIAGGEVLAHGLRAPDLQRFAVFPQHEETGGVIDLRIHQHDGADAGVAELTRRLQRREVADLLQDVR